MKSLIKQIFIILLAINTFACVPKDDGPVKIRVVSLQGKAKPVDVKTPDLNIKALREQGRARSPYIEIPQARSRGANNYQNSFYENKYNNPAAKPDPSKEQEVVYRNEFDKKTASDSDGVKYILDSNNYQSSNPIIIQNNSNKTTLETAPDNSKTVEIDLSTPTGGSKVTKKYKTKSVAKRRAQKVSKKGYFVQVGAFKSKKNANRSLAYMKKFNKGFVKNSGAKSGIKYKVVLGPFSKRSSAQSLYKKVKDSGHDALITKLSY